MTNQRRTNHKASLAMTSAWRHARRFQTLRGGSVVTYLSEALKMAWAELRANPVVAEVDKIIAEIRAAKLKAPAPWTGRRSSSYVYGCGQR